MYTGFLSRAMIKLGWQVTIFINPKAKFWPSLNLSNVVFVPVSDPLAIPALLPATRSTIILHTALPDRLLAELKNKHTVICFAHMPRPSPYNDCHYVFAVSQYVLKTLQAVQVHHCYPYPLYAVADFSRGAEHNRDDIYEQSAYLWDRRKARDYLLSYCYPVFLKLKPKRKFTKRGGLTLGIVSNITPIKQFSIMFGILSSIIKKFPQINIEIFGGGGYASIREFRQSLKPINKQVRFWGQQSDVSKIYPQLDFLMTGLPEKEALGLNVIEAQYCGTPVLAVNAEPFTETVLHEKTGYLYKDPRTDGGRDFEALLTVLLKAKSYLKPRDYPAHLAQFSFHQFCQRVEAAMNFVEQRRKDLPA